MALLFMSYNMASFVIGPPPWLLAFSSIGHNGSGSGGLVTRMTRAEVTELKAA